MEVKLKIKAEHNQNITITNYTMLEIIKDYNGDIESYFKDNFIDYIDTNDLELELSRCKFDIEDAKETLLKNRALLNSNADNPYRTAIDRTRLNQAELDSSSIGNITDLEEVKVNLDLLKKALPFVDYTNPKLELNHIYLNENKIEATDTRALIRIDNHEYRFNKVCFPTYFIEPLENGATLYLNDKNRLILKYNNCYYGGLNQEFKYPDFNNIIVDFQKHKNHYFETLEKAHCTIDDLKECILIKIDNNDFYYNKTLFEKTTLINPDVCTLNTDREDEELVSPLFLKNKNITTGLMPMEIHKSSNIEFKNK